MGASFGIALTSTIIATRSQVHTNNLSYHTNVFNPNYTETISNLAQTFQNQGLKAIEAMSAAQSVMWSELLRQSTMNSILDAIEIYVILHICVIPLAFLLKRKKAVAEIDS
jgi:DHA2 family multidrug resistance protein